MPHGKGSGEQSVRERFPKELKVYRSRRNRVQHSLAVMIDGDSIGVEGRIRNLDDECREQGVEPRTGDDMVAVFVPTWRIETWFAYLDGGENGNKVDEGRRDYPKLDRHGDCMKHVTVLVEMCRNENIRQSASRSLVKSCEEFGRLQR